MVDEWVEWRIGQGNAVYLVRPVCPCRPIRKVLRYAQFRRLAVARGRAAIVVDVGLARRAWRGRFRKAGRYELGQRGG